jgi:hypothetical protein
VRDRFRKYRLYSRVGRNTEKLVAGTGNGNVISPHLIRYAHVTVAHHVLSIVLFGALGLHRNRCVPYRSSRILHEKALLFLYCTMTSPVHHQPSCCSSCTQWVPFGKPTMIHSSSRACHCSRACEHTRWHSNVSYQILFGNGLYRRKNDCPFHRCCSSTAHSSPSILSLAPSSPA